MDSHDLGRGRSLVAAVLAQIQTTTMVIGIRSDILFPISEQQFIASHIPNATLHIIDSSYGHDGFLIEFEKIGALVSGFLEDEADRSSGTEGLRSVKAGS